MLSGRFDQVEPWLERAEVMGIAPGRIRILRGAAYLEQGNLDEAIHQLELAVQQLPDSVAAHALLARALTQADRSGERVLSLFKRTTELTPVTPEDYLYGAWVMAHYWPDQALKWLETLAVQHPTPVVHHELSFRRMEVLGNTYALADIEPALESATTTKAQMPDYIFAHYGCALVHLLAADVCKTERAESGVRFPPRQSQRGHSVYARHATKVAPRPTSPARSWPSMRSAGRMLSAACTLPQTCRGSTRHFVSI